MHSSCETTAASVPKVVSSMSVFLKVEPGFPRVQEKPGFKYLQTDVFFHGRGQLTGPCQRMRPALNCQSRRSLESDPIGFEVKTSPGR